MLSMVQINQMLKENFQRQLQEVNTLPEDLARGYKDWVHGLLQTVRAKLQGTAQATEQNNGGENGTQDV